MKYIRQLAIILAVTCVGEFLKSILPFPVPASIYGLVLMLLLLVTGRSGWRAWTPRQSF